MNSSSLSRLLSKAAAPLVVLSASWAPVAWSRLAPSALCSAGCLQLRIPSSTTGLNRAPDFILLSESQLCFLSRTPTAFAPRRPSWLLPCGPSWPHPIVAPPPLPHPGALCSLLHLLMPPATTSILMTHQFSAASTSLGPCSYSLAANVYIFNNPCTSPTWPCRDSHVPAPTCNRAALLLFPPHYPAPPSSLLLRPVSLSSVLPSSRPSVTYKSISTVLSVLPPLCPVSSRRAMPQPSPALLHFSARPTQSPQSSL